MAGKRARRLIRNAFVLFVPIGALKLTALWMQPLPGPAHASAGDPNAMPAVTMPASQQSKLSPQQRARVEHAAAYATSIRVKGFGASPFYYEPVQVVSTPDAPVVRPTEPGVPAFAVQVIMTSDSETKALINGKIYRAGDAFIDGWIVAEIDGFARTVTIADPRSGRTSTQAVRMPGER